jgi:hypothetical protein
MAAYGPAPTTTWSSATRMSRPKKRPSVASGAAPSCERASVTSRSVRDAKQGACRILSLDERLHRPSLQAARGGRCRGQWAGCHLAVAVNAIWVLRSKRLLTAWHRGQLAVAVTANWRWRASVIWPCGECHLASMTHPLPARLARTARG